jgi:NAD(P)-dependent dehydrogenase (short-subunit alcohol dehydrogenase family)
MNKPKVVLITGASSGIGRAAAERLAARGHLVFGTTRSAVQAADESGVEMLSLDLRDEAAAIACVKEVLLRTGRIDVLVNNAGYSLFGAVEETSPDEARELFDIHLLGALRMIRAVLPAMRQQHAGLILNMSSVLGFLPAPFMGFYAAAKHALEGLSESLDHEIREFGIRVALIEPDFTNTQFGNHTMRVQTRIDAYAANKESAIAALDANLAKASGPAEVASVIVRTIEGAHRLRSPAGGRARLLSRLRRFMPHAPVDRSIRGVFGLPRDHHHN